MNYQEATRMNYQKREQKTKTKGVILITDNRPKTKAEFGGLIDFRQSGFKQTQVDPLEVWAEINAQHQQDSLIEELSKRISHLEQKVKMLQKQNQGQASEHRTVSENKDKKPRRKFVQMQRKYQCHFIQCDKIYGSETSLKHHLKIKHKVFISRQDGQKENQNQQNFKEEVGNN